LRQISNNVNGELNMLKKINILLISFYIFILLPVQVFAGGFYFGSNHLAVKHKAFSRHKSKHSSPSFTKHNLKFHRKWHHKTKCSNKIYFPYYDYDPYYASYGKEKESYVEINIINDKKDEQTEPTVHKDKTFSPPRIINLEDVASNKSTERSKSSNKSENVILIYGTKVVETKISSD
jgi:hypothetical protein